MFERRIKRRILQYLQEVPAVVLLGPRQIGKTTLAREIAAETPDSLYLDFENPRDAARFADPVRYLELHAGRLAILDEIQRVPGLFRAILDHAGPPRGRAPAPRPL